MMSNRPWSGYSEELNDFLSEKEMKKYGVTDFDGQKTVCYTPKDDEIVLQWIYPEFNAPKHGHGYQYPTSGWALVFSGFTDEPGFSGGEPIAFAAWNDIKGIEDLAKKLKDPLKVKADFVLRQSENLNP